MTTARQRAQLKAAQIRQEISELEAKLAEIPAGIQSHSFDGSSTTWNRKSVLDEIAALRKRLAALSGRKERVATIRLNNSF